MAEMPEFKTGAIASEDNFENLWSESGIQDNILIKPSEFEIMAGQGAVTETAEKTIESVTEGGDKSHFGQCGELIQEIPLNTEWILDVCKMPPANHSPYYYYFFTIFKSPPCYICAQNGKEPLNVNECPDCLKFNPSYCEGQVYKNVTSNSIIGSQIYKKPDSWGYGSLASLSKIPQKGIGPCIELPLLEHIGDKPGTKIQGVYDVYAPEMLASASDNTANYQDATVSLQPIYLTDVYNPDPTKDITFLIFSSHAVSKSAIERSRLLYQHTGDYIGVVWRQKLQEWFDGKCTHKDCINWLDNNTTAMSDECYKTINMITSHFVSRINENCEILPKDAVYSGISDMTGDDIDSTKYGENWLVILKGCSTGDVLCNNMENFLRAESVYFTECPEFLDDVCYKECGTFDEMVCGRPSRANSIGYNVFYYPGRRNDYEDYIQGYEFRRRFGLIFNSVSDLYPCSCN